MHIHLIANRFCFAMILVSLAACGGGASAPINTSTTSPAGPTSSLGDFADPFILSDNNTFVAYATNGQGKNVQALSSADLRNWRILSDAMPVLPSWVRKTDSRVWAPEVIKLNGHYVLYFTARSTALNMQCIGAAVSAAPEGPFVDSSDKPLVCQVDEGGTIDASPLLVNNRLYLYFKSDGNCCSKPTYLFGQELTADGLGLLGQTQRLIQNERLWEGAVVEAPTMTMHAGQFYLFYSGNDFAGAAYAVGFALCAGPMGPCNASLDGPILKSRSDTPRLIGPGHQAVFQIGEQSWMAYHAWEELAGGQRGNRRFLYLDKLDWVAGKPVVRGPTIVP